MFFARINTSLQHVIVPLSRVIQSHCTSQLW